MKSDFERVRSFLRFVDREAAIWAVALIILALGNPESESHFTIFWPYYVWGIQSPGHGLGHSISYLFRGDVISSFHTHVLGIPAVGIILWRITTLQIKQLMLHRSKQSWQT